jgi:hypothetical protein
MTEHPDRQIHMIGLASRFTKQSSLSSSSSLPGCTSVVDNKDSRQDFGRVPRRESVTFCRGNSCGLPGVGKGSKHSTRPGNTRTEHISTSIKCRTRAAGKSFPINRSKLFLKARLDLNYGSWLEIQLNDSVPQLLSSQSGIRIILVVSLARPHASLLETVSTERNLVSQADWTPKPLSAL